MRAPIFSPSNQSESDRNIPRDCEAFINAISQIASGYIHELNNRLGPILLNAETIATSGQDHSGAASDIAQNARDLLCMLRDLEAILPKNLQPGGSVIEMLRLAKRIGHGMLRRRRLKVVLPIFDTEVFLTTDPISTFLGMILVLQAFQGPKEGEPGTLKPTCADPGNSWAWRIEVDPPCSPDEDVLEALSGLSVRNGWIFGSGFGFLTISKGTE